MLSKDVGIIIDKPKFWKETLQAWCEFHHYWPTTGIQVRSQVLWLNSSIRINNKPIIWISYLTVGMIYIQDVLNMAGVPMTYDELTLEFGKCITWLEYVFVEIYSDYMVTAHKT